MQKIEFSENGVYYKRSFELHMAYDYPSRQ